jgi:hypothetical protein
MHRWVVFAHVASAFAFMASHGASVSVAFRLRREREPDRVRALLDLSERWSRVSFGFLLLLIATGVTAGFTGRLWGRGWLWTSIGLLVAVTVAMGYRGTEHYQRVRKAVGLLHVRSGGALREWGVDPERLDRLLSSSRPVELAAVGFGGFLVILWLMMFQPF